MGGGRKVEMNLSNIDFAGSYNIEDFQGPSCAPETRGPLKKIIQEPVKDETTAEIMDFIG